MIHLTKIIAGLLVLLALAFGGYAWMLSRQPAPVAVPAAGLSAPSPAARLFPVVVASKAIPAGQVIAADSLQVAQLPMKPGGAFSDTAPLAGRVAILDLAEGTPLQENQLASGLALHLADGERAVAIKADEVMGVGNKVQVGDYVDVFVMLKFDGKDVERSQSRLLLARKRVLAFGSASVDGLPPRAGDPKNASTTPAPRGERPEPARTAVLAVPVEEVNRLTIGDNSGRLLLALRNPADLSEPDPKLFADLPGALQPVAARKGVALTGIDRAQAGLIVADLSGTSVTSNTAAAPARNSIAAPRPLTANAARPAARSGNLEVEIIRGDKRELTSY